jgi:hypothetical protein
MSTKHAEIYKSEAELKQAVLDGVLVAPYVAYFIDEDGKENVVFSNDTSVHPYEMTIGEEVMSLINEIRNSEVYCTEEEYNAIITPNEDGSYNECVATQPDGSTKLVTFNENVKYFVYE